MANDKAHNTATTEPGDRATPDVSLSVTAVAAASSGVPDDAQEIKPSITIAATRTLKVISIDRQIDSAVDFLDSQPDLTVTGTLVDGGTLQVSTSSLDFGEGAEVYLFDDFTGTSIVNGQVSETPRLGTGSYTGIDESDRLSPKKRGESNSVYGGGAISGQPRFTPRVNLPDVRECFHSLSLFYPKEASWTGSTDDGSPYTPKPRYIPVDSTFKVVWYFADGDYNGGSNMCVPSHISGDNWALVGNSTASLGALSYGIRESMCWEGWNTHEAHIKANSADTEDLTGTGFVSVASPMFRNQQSTVSGTLFAVDGAYSYNEASVPGWVDNNDLAEFYMTDLYFASTPARVVIADNPDFSLCRRKAVCPRTGDWTSTSAEVMLKLGDMDPAVDGLFLFVFDKNSPSTPLNAVGKLINPGSLT